MRLVKNKELDNDNLVEYSEFEILQRWTHLNHVVQYCDLPKVKNRKSTKFYNRLYDLSWDKKTILQSILMFPKGRRKMLVKELLYQSNIKDDGKWLIKGKRNLVAYILELAYNLGLMNDLPIKQANQQKTGKKDENSEQDKQAVSKTTNKRKQTRPRKEKGAVAQS